MIDNKPSPARTRGVHPHLGRYGTLQAFAWPEGGAMSHCRESSSLSPPAPVQQNYLRIGPATATAQFAGL